MGHVRYIAFYVLCGLAAAGAQVMSDPSSAIPMVGASGAISGVMGGYLLLYPRVRVTTLFVVGLVFVRPLPAWVLLIYWFVIQVLSGALSPAEGGGVAFWAHAGGFIAGLALIIPFRRPVLVEAKRAHIQLDPRTIPHRGWF